MSPDSLNPDALRGHAWVRRVDYFPELESTNDYALRQARLAPACDLPLVVVTDQQTVGRGRGSNRWWTSDGSLPFTVLLEPPASLLSELPRLSLTVGLAVACGLQQFVAPDRVRLKWPNDVYLDQRKVSGVLVEQPSTRPPRLVIGIGINVNNDTQHAPHELRGRAISLCEAAGSPLPRQAVLQAVLNELEDGIDRLQRDAPSVIDHCRSLCLLTGRRVELNVYGRRVAGPCEGIDDTGALLVHTDAGLERFIGGVLLRYGD